MREPIPTADAAALAVAVAVPAEARAVVPEAVLPAEAVAVVPAEAGEGSHDHDSTRHAIYPLGGEDDELENLETDSVVGAF